MSFLKHVKHLKTGKVYEFVEFVEKEVHHVSFKHSSSHVRVNDSEKNIFRYFPINSIEFVDIENGGKVKR